MVNIDLSFSINNPIAIARTLSCDKARAQQRLLLLQYLFAGRRPDGSDVSVAASDQYVEPERTHND